uniref:Uncharacterized protein n=1 Tax=viral metagenome TaxID=1070528 RepID=A0A6M3JZR9_9ZZZZ
MITLHETCLEYFTRRLSEGWKCISLDSYNAILQSPEGIIRPLDLRSDVLTLRPNANGVTIQCSPFPGTGEDNYEDVNEATADEDATYVYNTGDEDVAKEDDYQLPNHTTESGTINSVKVYGRARYSAGTGYIRLGIPGGWSVSKTLTSSYVTYDNTWAVNPGDSQPFEWSDIDALETYIYLYCTSDGSSLRCTQVYAEVDYTPIVAAGRSFGFIMG